MGGDRTGRMVVAFALYANARTSDAARGVAVAGERGPAGESTTGEPGPAGPAGPPGPAGGSCLPGEVRQPYVYPDGVGGSRCVVPPPPEPQEGP